MFDKESWRFGMLVLTLCFLCIGFQGKSAYADTNNYIYGRNSSGVFVRTEVSSIPAGTIASGVSIAISPDRAKIFGFDSSGLLVYQDSSTAISATTLYSPFVLSPDGAKVYCYSGGKIQYIPTSNITESSGISVSTSGKISASDDYVYYRDSIWTRKQKLINVLAGSINYSYPMALSADGSKILGANSSGLFYQEVSILASGTVSTTKPYAISKDGSRLYGFNSSNVLVYQDLNSVTDGVCSSSYTLFYVNKQFPKLSIVAPTSNQSFTTGSTLVPSISVSDPENRNLTVKYTIEPEANPRETKTVSGSTSPQTVNFSVLNMSSITKGTHRITFEVWNGINTTKLGLSIYIDKDQAPTVLGTGSGDLKLNESAMTPNGYTVFHSAYNQIHYFTIFNPNFQKVNKISPTFTDSNGNNYSLPYIKDSYGNVTPVGVLARADNTFLLFGQLSGAGTSGFGYMIMTTSGQIIDAENIDKDHSLGLGNIMSIRGSDPDKGILFSNSGNTSLNYVNSNDFTIVYTIPIDGSHYVKLTGPYVARLIPNLNSTQGNSCSVLDLRTGSSIVNIGSYERDVVNRSDGTIVEADRLDSTYPLYIRIYNTDFTIKHVLKLDSITGTAINLLPLKDGSVVIIAGSQFWVLQSDNTFDPTPYTFQSPVTGNANTADVFNGNEVVLTDSGTSFQSLTFSKMPSITVLSPTPSQQVSESMSNFTPSISVSDVNNSPLTCKYYIDSETTPRDNKTITNTLNPQTVNFLPININTLSVGTHTIKFEVSNNDITSTTIVAIIVSETGPTIGNVSTTSTETSITVTGDATSTVQDLATAPFRYTVGNNVSSWTASKTYTQNNLSPNTQYLVKFEAQDKIGETSSSMLNVFTLAQMPTVSTSGVTSTTSNIILTDSNPAETQYQITLGTQYLGSNGLLTDSPSWITVPLMTGATKQITVIGLTPGTLYTIKAKARNGAGVESSLTSGTSFRTLTSSPGAPSNIQATATTTSVTITWSTVSGATGYDVELNGSVSSNGTSTSKTFSGLTSGTQYTYRVRATFSTGAGSWSNYYQISTQPDSPGVPANLSASATSNSITVTWSPVVGALGYDIEVDGTVIDNGTNTTYTQSGLNPDSQHAYRVRARLSSGTEAWTNLLTESTLPFSSGVPVNLTAAATDTKVTLSWDPVTGATGYDIDVNGVVLDNGTSTVFVHSNLTSNSVQNYRVRARTASGTSDWSTKLTVITFAYPTPANVTLTPASTSIVVSWSTVSQATSYDLMVDGSLVTNGSSTTYTHSNLLPNTQHTYQVRATGPNGTSAWSQLVSNSTITDSVPVNVSTVSTSSKIIVMWSPVSGAVSYDVEVDGVVSNNGNSTTYTHNNPTTNVAHTYRVRTVTSTTTSGWSTLVTASVLPTLPLVPTGITTTASFTTIRLNWTSLSGATGYDVEVDGTVHDNGSNTTYLHSNLGSGTTHNYRVRAKNASGVGPWSNTVAATTTTVVYSLSVAANDQFNITFTASNVSNLNQKTFIVTYNSNDLDVTDLCSNTSQFELTTGSIANTDITITQFTPGTIVFTLSSTVATNQVWSGAINSIGFKSKITGQTSINYNIQ